MFYDLRKMISRVFLILAIFLAAPAIGIMATWNTLPGEPLYPLKRNLEKIASLIASPSYSASSELEIKLISRRLGETEKTIDKSSSAGLRELVSQAQSARKTVLGTTNTKAQSENSAQLITELRIAQTKLQEKKVAINTYSTGGYQDAPPKTVTNVVNITNIVYKQKEVTEDYKTDYEKNQNDSKNEQNQNPNQTKTEEEMVDEITNAEQEIEDIINDLEERATTPTGSSLESVNTPAQAPQTNSINTPPQRPAENTHGREEIKRGGSGTQSNTQSVAPAPAPEITPESTTPQEPIVTPELTPDTQNL